MCGRGKRRVGQFRETRGGGFEGAFGGSGTQVSNREGDEMEP